jgi:hypothetical protein
MKLNTVANKQSLHRDSLNPDRLFYVVAASIMFVFTAIGFRSLYLHGKGAGGSEMTSQIVPLIVVHGLAMFGWVILIKCGIRLCLPTQALRMMARVSVERSAGFQVAGTMLLVFSIVLSYGLYFR